jgi:hypothetical protein
MDQIFIAMTGLTAVFLTQADSHWHKYACLFGLAGQPFWFYTTYTNEQWGIFILSFAYTYAWFIGFKKYWIK